MKRLLVAIASVSGAYTWRCRRRARKEIRGQERRRKRKSAREAEGRRCDVPQPHRGGGRAAGSLAGYDDECSRLPAPSHWPLPLRSPPPASTMVLP